MNLRVRRIALLAVAFAALSFAVVASRVQAQETAKPAASEQKSTPSQEIKEAASKVESTEAGAEKKEKAEENEGKSSAAVQGLAKLTGMTVDHAYWFSVGLNFAIVVFILAYFAKKKLPGVFKGRTESIQKGMEEAKKSSDEARRRLTEVEERLSRLDVDIAQMRSEAEETGRAEEKRILSEGEAERKRIVEAAQQDITAAAGSARRELKAYATELAVDLAAKKIRVEKSTDQELVREFTANLGKDGN
ncbi:MAG: ATP synthase F0 subunit B [Acidobacteriia bacterium]|nr:ATP synthase F0 subunit B [Terriglobia bacterium]